jgi:hypothetical protein
MLLEQQVVKPLAVSALILVFATILADHFTSVIFWISFSR